jgi:uncharacterized protein (DUF2141 family)
METQPANTGTPPAATQAPPTGHGLKLVVKGVKNTRGFIGVLVFNSSAGWPEDVSSAFTSEAVPAQAPETVLEVHNLPAGEYAVVFLHNENLNKNWTGIGSASRKNNGACRTTRVSPAPHLHSGARAFRSTEMNSYILGCADWGSGLGQILRDALCAAGWSD